MRWPYQAKVMNTFEAISSNTVCNATGIAGKPDLTPVFPTNP